MTKTRRSYYSYLGRSSSSPVSWALGPSFLGLPVVVAGAGVLVAVGARRHAQAHRAALVAEEEARLLVVRLGAPPPALTAALCSIVCDLRLNHQHLLLRNHKLTDQNN